MKRLAGWLGFTSLTEKQMKRIISIACLLAGTALLAGCPKKATTVQPPTAGTQVSGSSSTAPGGGTSTQGSPLGGDNGANGGRGIGDANGPLGRKVIYFDFDKSEIKPEFADI